MTLVDDISMLAAKRESTPAEFAQWLKRHGDVYWWDKGKFWVVTRWAFADRILRGPEFSADRGGFFISRMPNLDLSLLEDFFTVVRKMMVMSDGSEHARRRGVAQKAMGDAAVAAFRGALERAVRELVAVLPEEGFEFVRDVAEPLPQRLLAELFAIPEADRPSFYRWSWEMTQFFGGASAYQNADGVRVNTCAKALREYFEGLLAYRREHPSNDVTSMMLSLQSSLGLTDSELVSQAVMMLVAGQVTTTDQLCNNFHTLLEQPERWAALAKNPERFPSAMEECNRLDPAVTFLFRIVKETVTVGDATFAAGDVVFVSSHCVNRDASTYDAPETFRPDRAKNPHMAYGHGAHYCLGAKLAREAMVACFRAIAVRFPHLALTEGAVARKHPSLAFSGFERLAVQAPAVLSPVLCDSVPAMAEVSTNERAAPPGMV